MVQPGSDTPQKLDLHQGGRLDLTQVLAGAPLASDLTNIGDFVKVVGHGRNDPGFGHGTKTTLEITGPNGGAVVTRGVGTLGIHPFRTVGPSMFVIAE